MSDPVNFETDPQLNEVSEEQGNEKCFLMFKLWKGCPHYHSDAVRTWCSTNKKNGICSCADSKDGIEDGTEKRETIVRHTEYNKRGNLIDTCQHCRDKSKSKVEDVSANTDVPAKKNIDFSKMDDIVKSR